MKKILITILLIILSVFALSACTPSVKSENEMKIDIQNYLNSVGEHVYEVEKLSITDRKTSKKDGTDCVGVDIVATTEYSRGTYSFVLDYKLYDQGWVFENAKVDSKGKHEVKAIKEPEQSEVENTIFKEYPNAKLKNKEILLDENKCVYYYEHISNEKYAKVVSSISLKFKFDTTSLVWISESPSIDGKKHTWDILGTWYPVDERTVFGIKGFAMQITEHSDTSVRIRTQLKGNINYDQIVSYDELDEKWGHMFETHTSGNALTLISISPSYVGTISSMRKLAFERR